MVFKSTPHARSKRIYCQLDYAERLPAGYFIQARFGGPLSFPGAA